MNRVKTGRVQQCLRQRPRTRRNYSPVFRFRPLGNEVCSRILLASNHTTSPENCQEKAPWKLVLPKLFHDLVSPYTSSTYTMRSMKSRELRYLEIGMSPCLCQDGRQFVFVDQARNGL